MKKKTIPGIHPSYMCAKCQTDLTIYVFPRVPQGFRSILGPRTSTLSPKIKIFKKGKRQPQGFTQTVNAPNF